MAARSGAVRVTLEGDAPRHVGASVAVRLATGREEGLVAPLAAVRGQGAEAAVLVAEVSGPPGPRMPAVVKRVPVNLGLADGDRVVLRQGPPAGAWLIATAPDLVTVDGPCVAVPQDR